MIMWNVQLMIRFTYAPRKMFTMRYLKSHINSLVGLLTSKTSCLTLKYSTWCSLTYFSHQGLKLIASGCNYIIKWSGMKVHVIFHSFPWTDQHFFTNASHFIAEFFIHYLELIKISRDPFVYLVLPFLRNFNVYRIRASFHFSFFKVSIICRMELH